MSDAAVGPVWLAINVLLFAGAWQFSRRLFAEDAFLIRVMHATVLAWAWIVGTSVLLGLIGWIAPWTLMAGGLLGAGIFFLGVVKIKPHATPPNEVRTPPSTSETIWLLLWGTLFVVVLSRIVMNGLLRFPTDWDSLMYHVPLVDQWLQLGSLFAPADAFWYVPGNNELITLWLVAPFSGDFLVALTNLPGAILLAVGAKTAADNLGVSRSLAHLAGLAAISTWPFLRQLVDAENDVAAAGLFMASLAYATRSHKDMPHMLMAAVSIGLLAGVKYYALGYAAVAWAMLVGTFWLQRGGTTALKVCVLSAIIVTVLGGYWYLRNYAVTGTPLYPKGLTQATDVWDQMRPNSWSSSLLGSGRPEVWPMMLGCVARMAGPCHWLAMVLAPLSVLWLLGTGYWLQRNAVASVSGVPRLAMALVIAASAMVWFLTPNTVETNPGTLNMLLGQYLPVRFGLCFLSVAVVCLAAMVHDIVQETTWLLGKFIPSSNDRFPAERTALIIRVAQSIPILTFSSLIATQFRNRWWPALTEHMVDQALIAANLWLLGMVLFLLWSSWAKWRHVVVLTLMPLAGSAASWAAESLADRWHVGFAKHYDSHLRVGLVSHITEMSPPPGPVCVCDFRYYPFLGSRRQFTACRPLWTPSWDKFDEYIRDHNIAFVVARKDDPFPQSRYEGIGNLIAEHPERFRLLREDNYYLLFRVVHEPVSNISARE